MAQFANAPNILLNSALPFDPRDGGTRLLGTAEYIAWEVLVAIVFRRLLRLPRKSIYDLIQVHAASMAFLGGAGASFGPVGDFNQGFQANLVDGAKGIPAILFGQYTVDTFRRGFHVPGSGWTMADIMTSAASKTISRPLFGMIYEMVDSNNLAGPLNEINEMQKVQAQRSNLRRS